MTDFLDGAHNLETLTCACGQPSGHESGACWGCYRGDIECIDCGVMHSLLSRHECDPTLLLALDLNDTRQALSRSLHSLRLLVRQLTRNQGYSTADEQADLRVARMLLAELDK